MTADKDRIDDLIKRLYATEAHARIIQKDEEQPLTVLLRDVRRYLESLRAQIAAKDTALRNIAEGNLGDGPGQANYERIREVARAALSQPAPAQEDNP